MLKNLFPQVLYGQEIMLVSYKQLSLQVLTANINPFQNILNQNTVVSQELGRGKVICKIP